MAKKSKVQATQKVPIQNAAPFVGSSDFETEFANETSIQAARNQRAQQKNNE